MKKKLLSLSPQALNAIFSSLSQDDQIVTWIADYQHQKQIYLSESFENLIGWSVDSLYEDATFWNQFLIKEDQEQTQAEVTKDFSEKTPFKLLHYRCHNPKGEILHIADHHFPIEDSNGNVIAHGGYASLLTPDQWYQKVLDLQKTCEQQRGISFYETILRELDINSSENEKKFRPSGYTILINNQYIQITPREAETLTLLLKGYSTKLIARQLNISPRTIELHIAHIREKSGSSSRLALLSHIQNAEEIIEWVF